MTTPIILTLDPDPIGPATLFERLAAFVPAHARWVAFSRKGEPWRHFLGARPEGCYTYALHDGSKHDFTVTEKHSPFLEAGGHQGGLNNLVADILKTRDWFAYRRRDLPLAVILRANSILLLGLDEDAGGRYYPSPLAGGHDALQDLETLATDFPGVFKFAA